MMFSVKNNYYELILLFMCKFISFVILLELLSNFYATLYMVLE